MTTHPHLAPRLNKECSYTSTPPLGLHGMLYGDLYLYTQYFTFLFQKYKVPYSEPINEHRMMTALHQSRVNYTVNVFAKRH